MSGTQNASRTLPARVTVAVAVRVFARDPALVPVFSFSPTAISFFSFLSRSFEGKKIIILFRVLS